MATPSTKTYLQIVNDAIDEAGAELASFAADGSDWDTNTDPMMNRFKKWANKAWRDLQVEANDWHWLDETAVVNINPGIMFYGEQPLPQDMIDLDSITIYDVDGTEKITNLKVSRVVDLTGILTASKHIGYVDTLYSDYSFDNQHLLDFGLKSGGEYITPTFYKASIFTKLFEVDNSSVTPPNPDAFPPAYSITPAGHTATFSAIPNGAKITSYDLVYYQVAQPTGSGSAWAASAPTIISTPCNALVTSKVAADSYPFYEIEFLVQTSADVLAANQFINAPLNHISTFDEGNACLLKINYEYTNDAGIVVTSYSEGLVGRWLVSSTESPEVQVCSTITVRPTELAVVFDGDAGNSILCNPSTPSPSSLDFTEATFSLPGKTSVLNGNATLTTWSSDITASAKFVETCDFDDPSTTSDSILIPALFGSGMYQNYSYDYGVVFKHFSPNTLVNISFNSYFLYANISPVVAEEHKSYVHSWKSYNWNEENDVDDFVESIRQTNNSTYRIISHDDPATAREAPLLFVPWDSFQNKYDFASSPPSTPRIITEDNTGRFRLYPAPNRPYTIMFDYIREPQELKEYTDVPQGLPRAYEDMVMWLTVRAYGEYDEQPSVVARANKRYKDLLMTLQQEYRPVFHFKPRRLY